MFSWPPPKCPVRLAVVIPSSNLSLHRDLRLKTRLAGEFNRIVSVFRVATLAIYKDPDSTDEDYELFLRVSSFMMTPPYLKIKAHTVDRYLKFAGLLPPLTVYSHNPEGRPLSTSDIRAGLVLNEYGLVDVGWKRPCRLTDSESIRPGEVILVRIVSLDPLICTKLVDAEVYAGYTVKGLNNVDELRRFIEPHDFVINTSKKGSPISKLLRDKIFLERVTGSQSICIVFGNPRKDFDELIETEIRLDLTINFVPYQGTLSVRTLEAVAASLAILNVVLSMNL